MMTWSMTWIVPLVAIVVGPIATYWVARLTENHRAANERVALKDAVDIYDKLPDNFESKQTLAIHLEFRVGGLINDWNYDRAMRRRLPSAYRFARIYTTVAAIALTIAALLNTFLGVLAGWNVALWTSAAIAVSLSVGASFAGRRKLKWWHSNGPRRR